MIHSSMKPFLVVLATDIGRLWKKPTDRLLSFGEVLPAFPEMCQVHRDFIPNFS